MLGANEPRRCGSPRRAMFEKSRDHLPGLVQNCVARLKALTNELLFAHSLEHLEKEAPIAGRVDDDNGFVVMAELSPGELLDELFERPHASWKRNKAVGEPEHQHFPLMKAGGDEALIDVFERIFDLKQRRGNDPGYMAAMIQHALRDGAHEPIAASAIDKPNSGLCHIFAKSYGGLLVTRVQPRA